MKRGILVMLVSVVLSGLTAWGVVEAATPGQNNLNVGKQADSFGDSVRTVNLSMSDYPDFTYAAENSVNAFV